MTKLALITGASSGIGMELARIHAKEGGDLVIVARREDALRKLKTELEVAHGVSVKCIGMDLVTPGAAKKLHERVADEAIEVDYLINNAGFGGHGFFHQRDWAQDQSMIQLNILALTELSRLFLPGMIERGGGKILNVASTAGMLPGPLQAVYYATKAYVLSLSQAIDEECRSLGAGVTVTALCPGPVKTEFAETGGLEGVEAFKNAPSASSVAKVGYNAMLKGKLVAINEFRLKLMLYWLKPFLPRRTLLKMSRKMLEKR